MRGFASRLAAAAWMVVIATPIPAFGWYLFLWSLARYNLIYPDLIRMCLLFTIGVQVPWAVLSAVTSQRRGGLTPVSFLNCAWIGTGLAVAALWMFFQAQFPGNGEGKFLLVFLVLVPLVFVAAGTVLEALIILLCYRSLGLARLFERSDEQT